MTRKYFLHFTAMFDVRMKKSKWFPGLLLALLYSLKSHRLHYSIKYVPGTSENDKTSLCLALPAFCVLFPWTS